VKETTSNGAHLSDEFRVGVIMKVRIALLCGLCAAHSGYAATFCVATADELTGALASAEQDRTASHEIRIGTGSYMAPAGGWHIDVDRRGITIAGGYTDSNCASESLDASLTVLDGHQAVRPLTIDTTFVIQPTPTTHDIAVRGLTFANGLGDRAGGLKISDAGPIMNGTILVERNIFRGNVATDYQQDNSAGALLAANDGPDFSGNVFLIVRGNLFDGNRAPDGSAVCLYSDNAIDASNNTVVGNQSTDSSLALRSSFAVFTPTGINYSNNVFWANNPDALVETYDFRADSPFGASHAAHLFNNDFQSVHGTPGIDQGNVSIDPKFIAGATGDFRLSIDSALLDAGVDNPEGGTTANDLDGAARAQGAHVDVGAYEGVERIFRSGFE
jgi:hypothetical protein